jgi:hypothetical protein
MHATTWFHDGVPSPVLQKADVVLHEPVACYPTTRVFNPNADGGHATIGRLLRRGECPSRWWFLGLDAREARQDNALDTFRLRPATTGWQGIACQLCHALIRGFPFTGGAQEAHVTGLVAHEEVFARGTLLLAAVIVLVRFGSGRAVDRTCRAIRPNRGVVELPSVACGLNSAANAAAVRAGSSSWSAKACFNTR